MWFVVTTSNKPKFYLPDGSSIDVSAIEWTKDQVKEDDFPDTNLYIVVDAMQAIWALHKAGVNGFRLKGEAREFGSTLGSGKWKYMRIT